MPDKNKNINIVRPDGSIIQGTPEELANLQFLDKGYHAETFDEGNQRTLEAATAEYYDTPGKKLEATIGGLASGVTVGGSDLLYPADAEERENAAYNPGYRMGGEIAGAIGASLTGVGPAGLLT